MKTPLSMIAGIDENGLGPRLGPLVVTGALFESAGPYDRAGFAAALEAGGKGGRRFGDSKAVMGFRRMGRGEEAVLALASLLWGAMPRSADEFLEKLGDPGLALRRPCPGGLSGLCFGEDLELPLFRGDLDRAAELAGRLRESLEAGGLRLAAVRSEALCPARFNDLFRGPQPPSKALVDLAAFERVIRGLHAGSRGEGLWLCGKVMGLSRYSPHLSLLRDFPLFRLQECREESRYGLQGLGELRFVLDGDALHAPVAVASMFGKYVREIFMKRINRFFASRLPGHAEASGYADEATSRLIAAAPPLLASEGFPLSCLLRDR